jgi:hypothetical protein
MEQIQKLNTLKDKWPSSYVSRSEVHKFSGGIISGKTLANLDSQSEGPKRIKCNGRVAYPVDSFIVWLQERCSHE